MKQKVIQFMKKDNWKALKTEITSLKINDI
jgi:hypothetical protein